MYNDGPGLARHPEDSLSFFERDCNLGRWAACLTVADCYASKKNDILGIDTGIRGIGKDSAKAREFYQKACKLNVKDACTE
jgi:TPR repeat protein